MNTRLRSLNPHSALAPGASLHARTIATRVLDVGGGPNGHPAIACDNGTETSLMAARNRAADGSGTWNITALDFPVTVGCFRLALT